MRDVYVRTSRAVDVLTASIAAFALGCGTPVASSCGGPCSSLDQGSASWRVGGEPLTGHASYVESGDTAAFTLGEPPSWVEFSIARSALVASTKPFTTTCVAWIAPQSFSSPSCWITISEVTAGGVYGTFQFSSGALEVIGEFSATPSM